MSNKKNHKSGKNLRELPAKAALIENFIERKRIDIDKNSFGEARKHLGIGQNVLPNWKNRSDRSGTLAQFMQIVNAVKVLESNTTITVEHFSDKFDKYDFGKLLHYSWQDIEKISDRGRFTCTYPGRDCFHTEDVAERIIKRYKGLYKVVYWKQGIDKNNRIVKSNLRIRYSLDIVNGASVVRCKLHMFYEDDDKLFIPYDGNLMSCRNKLYFYFMSVSRKHPDSRDMVTISCNDPEDTNDSAYSERPVKKLEGIITSTNMYGYFYSSPVVLVKTPNTDGIDEQENREPITREMRAGIGYIDDKKLKNVEPYVIDNPPLVLEVADKPKPAKKKREPDLQI